MCQVKPTHAAMLWIYFFLEFHQVSGIIMPIIRIQVYIKTVLWLHTKLPGCATVEQQPSHSAQDPSHSSSRPQAAQPGNFAWSHKTVLTYTCILTMGIIMPETCWYNSRKKYIHNITASVGFTWYIVLTGFLFCTRSWPAYKQQRVWPVHSCLPLKPACISTNLYRTVLVSSVRT
jgi:hypothetical protein